MAEPIFLDYDRAALDREYDNRAKVSGAAELVARYSEQSRQARAELPAQLDVSYGASAAETLDIFTVESPSPAPVQVFFHGGYWRALHKDDFSFVARAFRPAGAITVVVNYALMPGVGMDELVRQCRAALAWLWRNAGSFNADPGRIAISGHSAGGHLVAMMMATDWPAFESGLPGDLIKAGCGISGLYDLEPIRLCFLNDDLQLTPQDVARNSPIRLSAHNPGPLLLAVGALEGPEYLRQTQALVEAWRNRPEPWVMEGLNHFTIVAQLNDPASDLSRAVQRQMGLGN